MSGGQQPSPEERGNQGVQGVPGTRETHEVHEVQQQGVGRRRLFQGAAGGFVAGALAGGGTMFGVSRASGASSEASPAPAGAVIDLGTSYPFYDEPHQPGIQTAPQHQGTVMTFSVVPSATRRDVQTLLARWSAAAAQLMAGKPVGDIQPVHPAAIPLDTGEATDLDPSGLTVTFGLGPTLFDDRFGLAPKKPKLLAELPALPSDNLSPQLTGGDLSIQVCGDDPQVVYHAVRNLARIGRQTVHTRWTVAGFGRASAGAEQQTQRNLMGFRDGTRNVTYPEEFDKFVWVDDDSWFSGGTYQVVRKIRMFLEIWDADRISDQQTIFGRTKREGAPLTGTKERDTPDFAKLGDDGAPVIDPTSHVALAAFENNGGMKILRRSFNYTDGLNADGQLDSGLLFIAYMNDPQHFIDLQTKLGRADLLNEYISHIGSGIFAIPPAPKKGEYVGQALFD